MILATDRPDGAVCPRLPRQHGRNSRVRGLPRFRLQPRRDAPVTQVIVERPLGGNKNALWRQQWTTHASMHECPHFCHMHRLENRLCVVSAPSPNARAPAPCLKEAHSPSWKDWACCTRSPHCRTSKALVLGEPSTHARARHAGDHTRRASSGRPHASA